MSRRIWVVEWDQTALEPIHYYRGATTMNDTTTPKRVRSLGPLENQNMGDLHRRSSSLNPEQLHQCLHELDQTVASVQSLYGETSTEDGSIQSLTTDFGHSVLTSRFLIKNMERLESGSVRSGRTSGSRSSRGGRRSLSSRSTRKRGSSLERVISQTILATASTVERAHFLVEDSDKAAAPSTEDILNDLDLAHSVLESEINSAQGNLLPPINFDNEPDLLPPTEQISWTDPQWQPSWNEPDWAERPSTVEDRQQSQNSFDPKSSGTLITEPESFNASIENFETTFFTNESDPELQDSLFAEDPFATPKWMEFQKSPFSSDENEKLPKNPSPSFIADFSQGEKGNSVSFNDGSGSHPEWNWV